MPFHEQDFNSPPRPKYEMVYFDRRPTTRVSPEYTVVTETDRLRRQKGKKPAYTEIWEIKPSGEKALIKVIGPDGTLRLTTKRSKDLDVEVELRKSAPWPADYRFLKITKKR